MDAGLLEPGCSPPSERAKLRVAMVLPGRFRDVPPSTDAMVFRAETVKINPLRPTTANKIRVALRDFDI
jgi:hypothetical protein